MFGKMTRKVAGRGSEGVMFALPQNKHCRYEARQARESMQEPLLTSKCRPVSRQSFAAPFHSTPSPIFSCQIVPCRWRLIAMECLSSPWMSVPRTVPCMNAKCEQRSNARTQTMCQSGPAKPSQTESRTPRCANQLYLSPKRTSLLIGSSSLCTKTSYASYQPDQPVPLSPFQCVRTARTPQACGRPYPPLSARRDRSCRYGPGRPGQRNWGEWSRIVPGFGPVGHVLQP